MPFVARKKKENKDVLRHDMFKERKGNADLSFPEQGSDHNNCEEEYSEMHGTTPGTLDQVAREIRGETRDTWQRGARFACLSPLARSRPDLCVCVCVLRKLLPERHTWKSSLAKSEAWPGLPYSKNSASRQALFVSADGLLYSTSIE
jgi:hypothetical protein